MNRELPSLKFSVAILRDYMHIDHGYMHIDHVLYISELLNAQNSTELLSLHEIIIIIMLIERRE